MMMALPMTIGSVGASRQISQPRIAAHSKRRILQRSKHRDAGETKRPNDADDADHRHHADKEHEAEIKETGRRPRPGNGRRADKTRADELPKNERDPVDAPEIAGDRLAQRIGDRSE